LDSGHDVVRAADLGLARAADEELLKIAQGRDRLFVTRDRDFGRIVFLNRLRAGVVYLRMAPSTQGAVHDVLDEVLQTHDEVALKQAFVAITPAGYRIRGVMDLSSPSSRGSV
jgi:predicted nuclease of predicted toxin-antitoxin system